MREGNATKRGKRRTKRPGMRGAYRKASRLMAHLKRFNMCKNEHDASLALIDKASGNVWNVGQNWREPAPKRKAVSFWQQLAEKAVKALQLTRI